jgi:hypothetical protein
MRLTLNRHAPRLLPLLLAVAAACSRDELTAPTLPPVAGAVTVDASAGWAYLSLGQQGAVAVVDPAASTAWDVAFNATTVTLNGGAAGPGGVVGYCLCQNSAAQPTTQQILALTAASELADFETVSAAQIPAASAFVADRLVPALTGWHVGTGAGATAAADAAWLLRLRDGTALAKLRVVSLAQATATTPGRVTLEYAVQPSAAAALGAVRTLVVDVPATGAARVDLLGGGVTTSATAWDLRFEGWTLRLNGGVSGSGTAAATPATVPFAALASAVTEARAYKTDAHTGVFATNPWYRYNLRGDHVMSPTFDVYLVKRGDVVYKVQLTDYYGPAGEPRRISLRYERIAG